MRGVSFRHCSSQNCAEDIQRQTLTDKQTEERWHMNKTWKSARGDILKPLSFFFSTPWDEMLEKPSSYSLCSVFFFLPTMCQDMSEKQVPETNHKVFKNGAFSCQEFNGASGGFLIKEGKHHKLSCQSCRAGVGKTLRGVQRWAESLC